MESQRLLTIERGAAFLSLLAREGPTTVAKLAAAAKLPVSTAYRYVASLRDAGLIWELPGGRVGLGPRCVQLELGFREALDAWVPRQPVMMELAEATGETVSLLVPLDHEVVCIDTEFSPQTLRYAFERGMTTPLVRGAAGKAVLAHLDPDRIVRSMADAELQAEERTRLHDELPRIREVGFAVSREEVDLGAWAVAVPVFDESGDVEGALCLIAPTVRVVGREAYLIAATREAGRRLPSIKGWGAAAVE